MQGEQLVPVSEAKVRFHEVIRSVASKTALLLRHGRPVAALLSYDAYVALLDRIEDLQDRLAIYEARNEGEDLKVPWDKVKADAGLMGRIPNPGGRLSSRLHGE